MMDWKSKLTSRKFWVAIASFVTMMLTAFFGQSENEAAKVTALIMAGASVVAYVVGEGLVDAADAKTAVIVQKDSEDDTDDDAV